MSQTTFLKALARHAPRVAFSRLRNGPGRPSWSYGFELFTTALRHTSLTLADRSWEEQRASMDAFANRPSRMFDHVERSRSQLGGVNVTWFTPTRHDKTKIPTILYLHGGGYVFGSPKSHGELIARIALASPARVVAADYRLAPEHPFPAGIDDCVSVYEALLASSGVDPKNVIIAGDSAGGGLTMAVLQRVRDSASSSSTSSSLPAGAVLICPWVDLTAEGGSLARNAAFDWGSEEVGHRWIKAYLAGHDPKDPLVSPVNANFRGLPPMLVQVGSAELLHDQAAMFATRAKEAGVDVRFVVEPDQIHDWHSFAWLFSHCGRAIDDIGAFVRSVT